MIRQFAVVWLSLFPFALSVGAAYLAWEVLPAIEGVHMVATVLVWIAAFAVGTQIFWKVVGVLAQKQ